MCKIYALQFTCALCTKVVESKDLIDTKYTDCCSKSLKHTVRSAIVLISYYELIIQYGNIISNLHNAVHNYTANEFNRLYLDDLNITFSSIITNY